MENYEVKGSRGTYFIPYVKLEAATGWCVIQGESYLENTTKFYDPILDWLKRYCNEVKHPIVFNVKLSYFNTSSSKSILEMLKTLREFQVAGGSVTVNWYYRAEDEDMHEEAEDFMADTGLEMNLIAYTSDEQTLKR